MAYLFDEALAKDLVLRPLSSIPFELQEEIYKSNYPRPRHLSFRVWRREIHRFIISPRGWLYIFMRWLGVYRRYILVVDQLRSIS